MSRHNKKNGVPDRWLDYRAVGKRLPGTRFIPFKVPLKQSLNWNVSRSDVFGPWELLDALKADEQTLGLIIDLTFTARYYKLQDVPETLLYVKILTAGHEVPSDDTILSFKRAVWRFLRDNADNDKLIGVHCTHGLNRTGYLICRYLIDVDGMDPDRAVDLFNASRGHHIERQNYVRDLQRGPKRSNKGMEEAEQEPKRGRASQRPDDSDDRPPVRESGSHRSFGHRSHHPRPPNPPLLRTPPFCVPSGGPPQHPYRWAPPHLDGQWRPPRSELSRSQYPPAEPEWRRRAAPPPLPRYAPRWTGSNDHKDRGGRPRRPEQSGPVRQLKQDSEAWF